jgi:prolipoprotein diacylglyceryltransferase
MRQIILDFGTIHLLGLRIPLRLPGYGLMVAMGFLLGILLARWRAKRCGESPDYVTNCGVLALIGGIVGARLAYVIQHWDTQFASTANPLSAILEFTSGGLIYYGGLILGVGMVLVYLKLKRLPVRRYLDIVAVSMMLGLAFGRAGCLLNGCCFGANCSDSWALGMKFPMYSQPLLKFGDSDNPYSIHTESPSPVYDHQFAVGMLHPDDRLLSLPVTSERHPIPPRYLHGRLTQDQLSTMFMDPSQAREKFLALTGGRPRLDFETFQCGLKASDAFLRGSENWDDAALFDADRDNALTFDEAWAYLQARKDLLMAQFDANHDGALDAVERHAVNEYLQANLVALAENQWSRPVQPVQALAIVNALMIAAILTIFFRMRTREGQVFALLLILYGIVRFIEESIRDDNPHNLLQGVLTHNQYTSIALLAAGIVFWLVLWKLPPSAGPTLNERLAASLVKTNSRKIKSAKR